MSALMGVVRGGRVEFEAPNLLPDGTRVRVEPADEPDGFIADEEWPTTPEGIAELVRRMDDFEPVILTAEDEARIEAARTATRAVSTTPAGPPEGFDP